MITVIEPLHDFLKSLDVEIVQQFCLTHLRSILCVGAGVGIWWLMRKPCGIPPGSKWTLPILGDLLILKNKDDHGDVRLPIRRLRQKFGDIFSIYMGPRLFIFVNGFENIHDLCVKNGDVFSDRPTLFIPEYLAKGRGIGSSSGETWKEQRKFALETLREFGFGRSVMEDKIHEEIEVFIDVIRNKNGEAFDMSKLIEYAVSNVICNLVFGKRFEYSDKIFQEYITTTEENFEAIGSTAVINFMPFLRFIPGDLFKFQRTCKNVDFQLNELIAPIVDERMKNYDENDVNSYISRYIVEMKKLEKSGKPSSLNREQLIFCTNDLFVAGTETTSTTLLWSVVYFLNYPEVLDMCYRELQEVVGPGRLPSMKDKPNLPYIEAFTMEILRICNIAIFNLPRAPVRDVTFHGYTIPHDAVIIPNLDSVLLDDAVWGDAGTFRPERFLDGNGKFVKNEKFLAFSLGRRNCLGESMAKMELFLFLSTLIQRFDFKPVKGENLPGLTGTFGVTHTPRPFKVHAVPR